MPKRSYLRPAIIVGAILVYSIYSVLPYESGLVEQYYSQGLFRYWRILWDYSLGYIPIPLLYLLLLGIIYYLIASFRIRRKQEGGRLDFGLKYSYDLLTLTASLLIAFYLLWGFNYKRVNVINAMIGSQVQDISQVELFDELDRVTIKLNTLRTVMPDSMNWNATISTDDLVYRPYLEQLFRNLSLDYSGRVRVRALYPKGALLHWSTAGVYLPFVNEGHIDPGLHPIVWPFTIIHEMSHGYGYTGEDVCNFWALLSCVNSDDQYVQYSGYLSYWRYLRSNAYRANKDLFYYSMSCVDPLVLNDLQEIYDYSNRYPDILPMLRDLVYDSYLKSHGISDGLKNYSRIIVLAMQWQRQYGSLILESSTYR